jgi:hypothetical protein
MIVNPDFRMVPPSFYADQTQQFSNSQAPENAVRVSENHFRAET